MRADGDDAVVVRIRADLEANGFRLLEIDEGSAARTALARLAAQHAAIAALRVRATLKSAELWTAHAGGGNAGALDVITVASSEAHGDEVLALRVVETLRARALTLTSLKAARPVPDHVKPAEPRPDDDGDDDARAPSTNEASTPAPPHALQLWLELAPSLAVSPGGFGPELGGALSLRVQPLSLLSVTGFAFVPLWRDDIAVDDIEGGRASLATWLFGVAVDLHTRPAPLELSGGLGIASVIALLDGAADAPFEGKDTTERGAAPFARIALHVALGASVRVCARALVGLAVPELSIQVEQQERATWGTPLVVTSVGLELPLLE